ncbi:MAG: Lumazine-binding protein [Symploca sp. SIO3C6]|nr:Lumazine-binding protein [Symploca sp. SIO3C6]
MKERECNRGRQGKFIKWSDINLKSEIMFTGLIKETGIVSKLEQIPSGIELIINTSEKLYSEIDIKSTIAVNGRALTILEKENLGGKNRLKFYLSSWEKAKQYQQVRQVNLERAIRFGEEISGCLFYGIPCGQCKLISREESPEGIVKIKAEWNNSLLTYLDIKDQVYLDGVLLQIKDINQSLICVELYPETLQKTNLGDNIIGSMFNIEIDPIITKLSQILEKKLGNIILEKA